MCLTLPGRSDVVLFNSPDHHDIKVGYTFRNLSYVNMVADGTDAAATVDQIPEIDIICLSHNHYDHQDTNTLANLYKRFASRPPVLCVGLNGTDSLPSSIPRSSIVEMDWWEEREVDVKGKGKVNITFSKYNP